MKNRKNIFQGFTLIELLVVISIIGFLASVAMYSVSSARAKARDTQRIADIKQIQKALEMYYDDKKFYPQTAWVGSHLAGWSSLANELKPYMEKLPVDPLNVSAGVSPGDAINDNNYVYSYYGGSWGSVGKQFYMIVFNLEDKKHSLQTQDGVILCSDKTSGNTTQHYGTNNDGTITLGGCADALR